jgi:hypothetical protein
MKTVFVITAAITLAWSPQVRPASQCAVEGESIQWIADYCMLKMETDDEIAVSDCIEAELQKSFPDSCASNVHFKTNMCEAVIHNGTKSGTVDQCVKDPTFKGRVVEAGGVGA